MDCDLFVLHPCPKEVPEQIFDDSEDVGKRLVLDWSNREATGNIAEANRKINDTLAQMNKANKPSEPLTEEDKNIVNLAMELSVCYSIDQEQWTNRVCSTSSIAMSKRVAVLDHSYAMVQGQDKPDDVVRSDIAGRVKVQPKKKISIQDYLSRKSRKGIPTSVIKVQPINSEKPKMDFKTYAERISKMAKGVLNAISSARRESIEGKTVPIVKLLPQSCADKHPLPTKAKKVSIVKQQAPLKIPSLAKNCSISSLSSSSYSIEDKKHKEYLAAVERRILYVGGLAKKTSRLDLLKRFHVFGVITDIKLCSRHPNDPRERYGFVTFKEPRAVLEAIEKGNYGGLPTYNLRFGGARHYFPRRPVDLDAPTDDIYA